MSAISLFYRTRAEAAHRDAAEATLDNVRERHLRAAAAWEKMAERGERTESGRAVAKVAGQRDMVAAQLAAESLELLDIRSRNRQPRALRRKALRDRRSNPARSAGHERGHSCEIEHYDDSVIWFTRRRGDAEGR